MSKENGKGLNKIFTFGKVKIKASWLLIILITGIALTSLLFLVASPILFEIWQDQKPAEPPVEFATGYAQILAYDNNNGTLIENSSVTIYLFNYTDEGYFGSINAGETHLYNCSTLGLISIAGYWNYSISVYARNDSSNPYINEYFLTPKADPSNVSLSLYKINSSIGSFNGSDLPIGTHELTFDVGLDLGIAYNHSYANPYFIPEPFRKVNQSYHNVTYGSTWLGMEGNVTDVIVSGIATQTYLVGNVTVFEFISIFTPSYNIIVQVNVTTSINRIFLFSDQIDDFQNGLNI